MSTQSTSASQPLVPPVMRTRILLGGGIALFLIILFLAGVDETDPAWPRYWMIKPLLIVPAAGAFGGFCYYWLNDRKPLTGWQKPAAMIAGLLIYLIGLWMGTVLGLDGTLWN